MVFLEHRPRVTLDSTTLFTTVVEATALLFVQRQAKGAILVDHVTPPLDKMAALYGMIVRELNCDSSAANSRQYGLHFRRTRY